MKKDKNIFNFSNLVSLVNEEEDISNNIQDNIAKKNNFIKHISDKNNFFANLKKFIPNIYFINTKTLGLFHNWCYEIGKRHFSLIVYLIKIKRLKGFDYHGLNSFHKIYLN